MKKNLRRKWEKVWKMVGNEWPIYEKMEIHIGVKLIGASFMCYNIDVIWTGALVMQSPLWLANLYNFENRRQMI